MNYKRIVPNTISGISLVLGVFSIFYTQEQNFFMAAICIILSVVADSLDGRAARALGVQGPFGVEMDSLCDLGSLRGGASYFNLPVCLDRPGLVG